MSHLISILIPNFNKAAYLNETLDSIIKQSYINWECIIVDDHSTDHSWEILEEYAEKDTRIKIFKRPDSLPKGGNSCRNYAFSLANGQYIQWFDSDDLMEENLFKNRLKKLEETNADFILGHGQKFEIQPGDLNMVFSPFFTFPYLLESFFSIHPPWLTPSIMLTRDFIIRNKLSWNPAIHCFQDIAYNVSCFFNAEKIAIMNNSIDWYWRKVPNSTGNSLYLPKNYSSNVRLLGFFIKKLEGSDRGFVKGMALLIIRNSLERIGLTQVIKLINPLLFKGIISFEVYLVLLKSILKKYKTKNGIAFVKSELEIFLNNKINFYLPIQTSFGSQGIEDLNTDYYQLKKDFVEGVFKINNKTYHLL